LATAFIVLFGSFEGMRPPFLFDGEIVNLGFFCKKVVQNRPQAVLNHKI